MTRQIGHEKLIKLCDLSDTATIFDCLGRMQIVIDLLDDRQDWKPVNAFAYTYYLVSKEIADQVAYRKEMFQDFPSIERLDINFAKLYFKTLQQFLLGETISAPWQIFYNYTEHKIHLPFIQMVLGINAHINGDLAQAILESSFDDYSDYQAVNTTLLQTIPAVMKNLAFHEHDFWGMAGVVLQDFVENEFQNLIIKWRNQAWDDSLAMKAGNLTLTEVRVRAEQKARQIINLFEANLSLNVPAIVNGLRVL